MYKNGKNILCLSAFSAMLWQNWGKLLNKLFDKQTLGWHSSSSHTLEVFLHEN